MEPPKKIAHIGIAVKSLNDALPFYTNSLDLEVEKVEKVESEGVKVAFLKIGESRIELLEPLFNDFPINKFIERRGEGIHHIALEVDDINHRLKMMQENGIRLINETARNGANDSLVSFIHPKVANGVLLELYQQKEDE